MVHKSESPEFVSTFLKCQTHYKKLILSLHTTNVECLISNPHGTGPRPEHTISRVIRGTRKHPLK